MPNQPDLSEFNDWLKGRPDDPWPYFWEPESLSKDQQQIVNRNALILLDSQIWKQKVTRFEVALAMIDDEAERAKTRWKYKIHFDHFRFPNVPLVFNGYQFPCDVSFTKSQFGDEGVSFVFSQFHSEVSFSGARFSGGEISFQGARFGKGAVYFNRAEVRNGTVLFQPLSNEISLLYFNDSTIDGSLCVSGHFKGTADFSSLRATGTINLSDSSFDNIPDFCNAIFERPPEVAGITVNPPKMKHAHGFNIAAHPGDVAKLRKLKSMAMAASDHSRDGYFFALEMQAKRGWETIGWPALLLDSFYAGLSGYGQSVWRPLLGFAASFAIFAFIYSLFIPINALPWHKTCIFALEYSFHNTMPLLNTLFRFALTPEPYKTGFEKQMTEIALLAGGSMDWIINFSVLQQAFGTILLFLLLLGLRNKFRMK